MMPAYAAALLTCMAFRSTTAMNAQDSQDAFCTGREHGHREVIEAAAYTLTKPEFIKYVLELNGSTLERGSAAETEVYNRGRMSVFDEVLDGPLAQDAIVWKEDVDDDTPIILAFTRALIPPAGIPSTAEEAAFGQRFQDEIPNVVAGHMRNPDVAGYGFASSHRAGYTMTAFTSKASLDRFVGRHVTAMRLKVFKDTVNTNEYYIRTGRAGGNFARTAPIRLGDLKAMLQRDPAEFWSLAQQTRRSGGTEALVQAAERVCPITGNVGRCPFALGTRKQ